MAQPEPKKSRNRTDLNITNGFEFGLGFWLAGLFGFFLVGLVGGCGWLIFISMILGQK